MLIVAVSPLLVVVLIQALKFPDSNPSWKLDVVEVVGEVVGVEVDGVDEVGEDEGLEGATPQRAAAGFAPGTNLKGIPIRDRPQRSGARERSGDRHPDLCHRDRRIVPASGQPAEPAEPQQPDGHGRFRLCSHSPDIET